MLRNILVQSFYQLGITLFLVYDGKEVFGINAEYLVDNGWGPSRDEEYLGTFVFNTFVLCQVCGRFLAMHSAPLAPAVRPWPCLMHSVALLLGAHGQVFNEFNARSIGDKLWVYYDLHRNAIFSVVIFVTIGLQIFIVEIGGQFTSTTGLTLKHWGWSVLLACFTAPLGVLMRLIPVKENPAAFANFYETSEVRPELVYAGVHLSPTLPPACGCVPLPKGKVPKCCRLVWCCRVRYSDRIVQGTRASLRPSPGAR
jgi:hypothetical protein